MGFAPAIGKPPPNPERNSQSLLKQSVLTDIRRLCQRLGLQATDCLHHFVMGLRPDIQSHVILAQPENFDQAENLAKLKETTLNTTKSSVPSAEDLAMALLGQIKSTNDTQAKPVPVAAFEAQGASHQSLHTGEIKRLIQREVRNALRGMTQNIYEPQQRRSYGGPQFPSNGASNYSPRNR